MLVSLPARQINPHPLVVMSNKPCSGGIQLFQLVGSSPFVTDCAGPSWRWDTEWTAWSTGPNFKHWFTTSFLQPLPSFFFLIQFLSKWTYIHTPGIHTNVKLIYADYAMVLQKTTQETKEKTNNNNKKQKTHKQNRKKEEGQKYIRKAKGRHTFTRTTATAIIS